MIQLFQWKLITEVAFKCFWTAKYPWEFQNRTSVEWEDFSSVPCYQPYIFGRKVLCQEATSNTGFCPAVFTGKQEYSSEGEPAAWGGWDLLNSAFINQMNDKIQDLLSTADTAEAENQESSLSVEMEEGNLTNSSKQHLLLMPVLTQSPAKPKL